MASQTLDVRIATHSPGSRLAEFRQALGARGVVERQGRGAVQRGVVAVHRAEHRHRVVAAEGHERADVGLVEPRGRPQALREAVVRGDTEALRALTELPHRRLKRIGTEPAAAWRAGDAEVIAQLAGMRLASLGLRVS